MKMNGEEKTKSSEDDFISRNICQRKTFRCLDHLFTQQFNHKHNRRKYKNYTKKL